MSRLLSYLMLAAGLPAMAAEPIDPSTHRAGVEAWHAARIERLKQPAGWLSLVGLHWIEEGRHAVGAGEDNDIVLNTGPARLGTIERAGDGVHFTPDPSAGVAISPPAEGRVRLDPGGEHDPTVVSFNGGDASFVLIERSGRYGLRVRDAQAPTRTGFIGIERFPVDPAYRVEARFLPHPEGKTIDIASVINTLEPMANPGVLEFELNGEVHRLEAILEAPGDESYFVIFADRTNREQTYGAGRFVYTDGLPRDGKVVLDFNKAYNPPCALNAYSTCPLPPPENRMDTAVDAGEKRYLGKH
ncbi:DUF1684 domain-containing protein [Pseudomarimonas salicorniae]|uniref:DUF1684 domain-containing protein n=1 Tax=Pseudomarimonas salicorniae TaxID=2933270 RepID=A0ABT0GGX2_9GAMM|nr:DUF1684 domain-containing protein [Lysobacter sp. CAU 1642]MCK7593765.1 DUF1684 domain-containing protein [Lysobacter sp. CAU 1642]